MKQMNVGIVGCGMIAKAYYKACGESQWLNPAACTDLLQERAEDACKLIREKSWGEPTACSYEDILANDDVDMVVNLANPKAHYSLSMSALSAGKHVYLEKPLAVTREEGQELLATAKANNVRIGCAPDTWLGPAHQTARAVLDSGVIGEPTAATFFFAGGGPDGYHQDPEFFFQAGAGAMFDVGVYSISHAVHLLGPVTRVSAMAKRTWTERTILSDKKRGQTMSVDVPTHVSANVEFSNGTIGTFMTSFDIKGSHSLPDIEIHCTEGSLHVPSPNGYEGEVIVHKKGEKKQPVDYTHGHAKGVRGVGAADLAAAVDKGRDTRASGEMAYHVLDIGLSFYDSSDTGKTVELASTIDRPPLMPEGLVEDITD